MAKKGQKFKKYELDYKLKIIKERQAGASYSELSRKYDVPEKSIQSWMRILKRDGSLDVAQRGRPTDKEIDYKERYEILKKFQDFLDKKKDENSRIIQTINIVVDEAHNILYEESGQSNSHKNVLEVFEQIVKEGRKFGCYLMVSSQRPSDISPTIISQLHNYFIHKLVNPGDIQRIRKAVAYLDENSLDFLTVMAPGECIISGTAIQMPSFVYVDQVSPIYRPHSENVVLFGEGGLLEV